MAVKIILSLEETATAKTKVGLVSLMNATHVFLQMRQLDKSSGGTERATEWLFTCVESEVQFKGCGVGERLTTHWAPVRLVT